MTLLEWKAHMFNIKRWCKKRIVQQCFIKKPNCDIILLLVSYKHTGVSAVLFASQMSHFLQIELAFCFANHRKSRALNLVQDSQNNGPLKATEPQNSKGSRPRTDPACNCKSSEIGFDQLLKLAECSKLCSIFSENIFFANIILQPQEKAEHFYYKTV